ncbi:amidohydrolase family protein [Marisediminicola sp. LYQ134]|uniref:amidohydrolase family protein n=1 Tax=Marisediminicola sp. LYQ134 TaxID=3391061 RepID=UPI003983D783
MSTFISSATVITMDPVTGSTPITASIRIDDGLIVAIGTDLVPGAGDTVIDGTDRLVAPGLVNAHTHSWETLFKGRYDNLPLELWMLFSYPILGNSHVSPDLVRLRTQLFAAESLKAGVTTVIDDVLENPTQDFDQLDAVFEVYGEVGIRANISGHIINKPFVDTLPFVADLLDESVLAEVRGADIPTTDDYLAFSREAFTRYHGAHGGRLRYMVAPSGPQRCTDDLLVGATQLALENDAECHIHVLETQVQRVTGQEFYGKTLPAHLAEIGALSPNTTFAHGIWVSDDDIALMADAQVSVSHNPISNMKLGSGLAPWRKYQDAGVNLGLGSDGASSSDTPRMLEVLKAAALLHKVGDSDFELWPTVDEVLRAGTIGGARSGVLHETTGSLEVGKRADLVVYNLDTLAFTPRNKLDLQLVYSENGSSIDYVMVDGKIVVDHGELTTIDEHAIIAEFASRRTELQSWQDDLEKLNRVFVPGFTEMYHRCTGAASLAGV